MKVLHVVAARPNFMKIAPIRAEMMRQSDQFQQVLVHTGQHYDANMSKVFLEDLDMPMPDEFLNVGSGTHAEQTARVMLAFEPVLLKYQPDWTIVVGDVNSTMACALVCAKLGRRVAHVEAGLRSNDRTMPEEINRIVTDHICDRLYTPSPDGNENLRREGVPTSRICLVGNVMIDSLVQMLPRAQRSTVVKDLRLRPREYILVTMHRSSNVDDAAVLRELLDTLVEIALQTTVVFPVHPRTRKHIEAFGLQQAGVDIRFLDPKSYLDFLALMDSASAVLTDSGGVQEETTWLGVPCLTVRPNTERPITITQGTNRLVAGTRQAILEALDEVLHAGVSTATPPRPDLWDGHTAQRIAEDLLAQG